MDEHLLFATSSLTFRDDAFISEEQNEVFEPKKSVRSSN